MFKRILRTLSFFVFILLFITCLILSPIYFLDWIVRGKSTLFKYHWNLIVNIVMFGSEGKTDWKWYETL